MNKRPLEIYLFHCSNSLDTEALRRSFSKSEKGDKYKIISLPCSGKLELIYLLKAFESGADGVVLITCKHGECKYLEGNLRAKKRTEAIRTLLQEIGLDKGRIKLIQKEDSGVEGVMDELEGFIEKIRNATAETFESSQSGVRV